MHYIATTYELSLSGTPAVIVIAAILTLPMFIRYAVRYAVFRARVRAIKRRNTVVTEYQAPPNIPPAFFGTMIDNRSSAYDLIATILSLHLKGYLRVTYGTTAHCHVVTALDKDTSGLYEHERMLHDAVAALPEKAMLARDYASVIFPLAGAFNVAVQRGLQKDGYYFFTKDIDSLSAGQYAVRMIKRSLVRGLIKPWNWPGFVLSVAFWPFGIGWAVFALWYYTRLGVFNYRTGKWEQLWPELAGYYTYLQVVEAPKRSAALDQDIATGITITEHDPYLTAAQFEKQWNKVFTMGREIGAGGTEYQTY